MSFWRKEVIDFSLDRETAAHVREQKEWIAREPQNPRPWYNLAQLYRMEQKQDEALALLLEAVRLDDAYAVAHVALSEIYAVRQDYGAAWRHARKAEAHGDANGVELLRRHDVCEPSA
ncbi:MAG TPA: tetratricopeptide repeat protein [Bryobacteraceae bacterium]|nr:tetratricopeptide repeat protein [Bryobacteraceae bacterium]